jgi:NADH-quinone oxidoreductase subunit K
MIAPLGHLLLLAGALFLIGMLCVLMRRNLIMILLGLEVMLNGAAVAFIGAASRWEQIEGQALSLLILAVAAAEVSVGLALIISIHRRSGSIDPVHLNRLR